MANLAVIGDIMLDVEMSAVPRDNTEGAPICLTSPTMYYYPGGAANVAKILHRLGHTVILYGFVGPDWAADKLVQICSEIDPPTYDCGLICRFSALSPQTTVKFRARLDGLVNVRLDCEDFPKQLAYNVTAPVETLHEASVHDFDGVVFSDYDKGVFNPSCVMAIRQLLRRWPKHLVCPKPSAYHGMWKSCQAAVMNKAESQRLTGKFKADHWAVTHGANGAYMTTPTHDTIHCPAGIYEEPQIVGAGDAFAAGLMDGLMEERTPEKMLNRAIAVAGEYVSQTRRSYWEPSTS